MEFALDRWITKHNAWIDVFGPNYMRWIFHLEKLPVSIGCHGQSPNLNLQGT